MMEITGRHFTVVGMARSGVAAAEFLVGRGAKVTINDSRPEDSLPDAARLRALGIEVIAGGHPRKLLATTDCLIVSPGVPPKIDLLVEARAAGLPVIGEVELAARFLKGRVIGITGTNGKTTTTTLIGELLAGAGLPTLVGGNIGQPLVTLVDKATDQSLIVAELSSAQLETVDRLHVSVAVLLNITPDHLDRYGSMEEYAAAKARIFRHQGPFDVAVLNADDPLVAPMASLTGARIIHFSTRGQLPPGADGIFARGQQVIHRIDGAEELLLTRADIPLMGDHNLENVMAGLAAGLACGASPESMRATVRAFRAVEHRLEFVAEIDGVRFYNDSKATNVDAAIKSLEAFPGEIVVILGGKDKGSDFLPLVPLLRERCRRAILIGAAADKIGAALAGALPLERATTLDEAVSLAFVGSPPGTTVLLAPACASFDMFDNYEHRGRVFKQAVARLVVKGV